MKILVWTPGWRMDSGGVIALHLLCKLLRDRGKASFLWAPSGTADDVYDNPRASAATVCPSECVVVYPEIVSGDPLEGKVVVRWLLNRPGVMGGDGKFSPTDLVFHYGSNIASAHPGSEELFVVDMFPEYIHDRADAPRKGECYVVRKGHSKPRLSGIDNLARLIQDHECAPDRVGSIFRAHERFWSYDPATWLSTQAALCGCESYVLPDEGVPVEEWRTQRYGRYGVNYGIDDDYGTKTRHLLKPWIEECQRDSQDHIDRLLERIDGARK